MRQAGNANSNSSLQSLVRGAVKGALTAGGGALGTMFGMPAAGAAAGAALSRIIGSGDYKVDSNSLVGRENVPVFSNSKRGFRLQHKEFVSDITGTTAFNNAAYAINPGNPTLFPFLNIIAAGFQEYKIHGMIMVFKSTSADALNSTNTALGTVIMATGYNVARPAFGSKVEAEASDFSCSSKPSESFMHPIECAPAETPLDHLYVRIGPVPSGQDPRFYDWGLFQIATVGMQAAATIGELHVSYDIEFFKPRLPSSIGEGESFEWGYREGVTYSNADPFNTGGLTVTIAGGLGVTVNNLAITLPSSVTTGTFLLAMWWKGASTALVFGATTVSANGTYNVSYLGANGQQGNGSTTATQCFVNVYVTVTGYNVNGTTVTLPAVTLPSSGTNYSLHVTPVANVPNSSPY